LSNTYTSHLVLAKPERHDGYWDDEINGNFDILDAESAKYLLLDGSRPMTGSLTLAAGTAVAGTAPIKFITGTNLTTPEAGVIEYDGSHYSVTEVVDRRVISVAANAITTAVTVVNTTDETTVFTAPISADELHAAKVLRVYGFGQFSTHDANDKFTLSVKISGTTLTSLQSTAGLVSNKPFHFWGHITIRTIGESGTVASHGFIMLDAAETHENDQDVELDTTAVSDITVTLQWDSADVGNTATLDQAYFEILN